jgi:hypothetical protein
MQRCVKITHKARNSRAEDCVEKLKIMDFLVNQYFPELARIMRRVEYRSKMGRENR